MKNSVCSKIIGKSERKPGLLVRNNNAVSHYVTGDNGWSYTYPTVAAAKRAMNDTR